MQSLRYIYPTLPLLILLFLNIAPAVQAKGLTFIENPDFSSLPVLRPRTPKSAPKQFKEVPFVDDAPEPARTKQEQARGYILFNRPITQVVYSSSRPRQWERTENLTAFATPDEYEPMSFSLYPLRDMKDVRVKVSTLQSDKAKIEGDNLDLRLLTNWNIRYPRYKSKDTYRFMPELLEKANTVNLTKYSSQRFWLKIHVPADAPPGTYQGHITIFESGSQKGLQLPISLQVLNYKLLRDPKKRYSVYYYGQPAQFNNLNSVETTKARENDLISMQTYGIDMFPTLSLKGTEDRYGRFGVRIRHEELLTQMIKRGFKGPVPVDGGISHFYEGMVKGGKIGEHWKVSKLPPNDKIYQAIEKAFGDLKADGEKKGWPELIAVPIDEPSPDTSEFSTKVYAAIRRSGMRTYITKDPTSHDAQAYRDLNAIAAWSSQPFARSYSAVMDEKQIEYWSYPNHIAGEIKDHVVMQKGGRMTYGFGLWRSGYKTLIPWHWRWVSNDDDHFDYLSGRDYSGTGMRLDENLNIIPAVYWEAFREGYDDLRYLYTLQQAIVQREPSVDENQADLVNEARGLVQEIWDAIHPQKQYLSSNMWSDESFNAWRWKIALMTQALLETPSVNKNQSPSVLADTVCKKKEKNSNQLILDNLSLGSISQYDLGANNYKNWKVLSSEANMSVLSGEKKSTLSLKIKVDHLKDGGGEKGEFPVGWPRLRTAFNKGQLNLSDYDYLYFRVYVNSNRSEVEDDSTKFTVNFVDHNQGLKYDLNLDFGDKERTWIPVVISLQDMMKESHTTQQQWSNLKHLQLVLSESDYKHGAEITFNFSDLSLLKVKRPIIQEIDSSPFVTLSKPDYLIKVKGLGFINQNKQGHVINASILNPQGETLLSQKNLLTETPLFSMNLQSLNSGKYTLNLSIVDKDNALLSQQSKPIEVVPSFIPPTPIKKDIPVERTLVR